MKDITINGTEYDGISTLSVEQIDGQVATYIDQDEAGGWQPDDDMKWAKSVCENDVQSGFTYKVLQMINDGYVYTDIVVPTGGAVKTSDGSYYTESVKHTWDDTNARQSSVGDYKLRWLIYYYNTETPTISLLSDVIYACFDGVKFGTIFSSKKWLQYFDIINGAGLKSNVASLYSMFIGCSALKTIPFLDTSDVTNMTNFFSGCTSLQSIPALDTSKVTITASMFKKCSALRIIPLLDTSNVTSMSSMFEDCNSLIMLPLSDTTKVAIMDSMLKNCSSLQNILTLDTNIVSNMSSMIYNCSSLQTLKLNMNTVNNSANMFYGCSYLEFLDLTNIGVNLSLSSSTKYSQETLVNVIANLKDLTGLTAKTLTLGTTNLAKLTAEQIAVATAKNWSVA